MIEPCLLDNITHIDHLKPMLHELINVLDYNVSISLVIQVHNFERVVQ